MWSKTYKNIWFCIAPDLYEIIGVGGGRGQKPYVFVWFSTISTHDHYEVIEFGTGCGQKPNVCIWVSTISTHDPYETIGFGGGCFQALVKTYGVALPPIPMK